MRNLPDPLTIKAYISRDLPPELVGVSRYTRDLMDEYRSVSKGKVRFESFDPSSDKKVEDVMRKTLARARPRDAFVGEEDGTSGWGVRRWVVDPIDGTKNYIRGVPVWASLIAHDYGHVSIACRLHRLCETRAIVAQHLTAFGIADLYVLP